MPWLEDWRAFLDANPDLPVAWHSDWPYASINPFLHLYSYVTRQQVDEDGTVCFPPAWLAAHAITVEEALPMMTINTRLTRYFREDELGSLKAGKFADMIILSDNPITIDPTDLINIQVWMTMSSGNVEYCAAGFKSICPFTSPSDAKPASIIATASTSLSGSPPSSAIDGDRETTWNSGADTDQWIQINLGNLTTINEIRLVVSQYPAGDTIHQIWGGAEANNLKLLYEFKEFTDDLDTLEFKPSTPLIDIQYIKIITIQSPSWVAWREIEVISP